MQSKIFAMYLPQYHEIEENNEFWGKGFTDWVSVKNAKPLYKNHIQPKTPVGGNYYDLSTEEDVRWQADLASKYGISGFGIYHYWFNDDKNLMTKPAEIIYNNKDLKLNYFFAWDNISWKRTWSNVKGNDWSPNQDQEKQKGPAVLINHELGDEKSWENHFNFLLKFFKDERYEKKDNKPIFLIYHYEDNIDKMEVFWDNLAKNNGFDGIHIIYRYDKLFGLSNEKYSFFYEPAFSGWGSFFSRVCNKLRNFFNIKSLRKYNYDKVWKNIIKHAKKDTSKSSYYGAFVNYDDTPRRGKKGRVVVGANPEKFGKYLSKLLEISSSKEKKYIFLTAWNEWGEGAYLEPDTIHKYDYLKQIEELNENNR